MIYTPLTIKAMQIAYNAHQGQYDLSGVPYIFHPYHVAEQMDDEFTTCAALLHDVAEDTDITIEQLAEDFPAPVIEALRLLTHSKNEDYFEYVSKIRDNPIAKAVKLADIAHNSDQSRVQHSSAVTPEKLEHWQNKYEKAKKILG